MSASLWKEAREKLKVALKKEVEVMREVLANMHQEELNLLLCDKKGIELAIQQRSGLLAQLGTWNKQKTETMEQLKKLVPSSKKEAALEQYLALDDESYSEITLLQDQLNALKERINFQHARNQSLIVQIKRPMNYNQVQPQKKRNIVTTCEKDE